MAQPRRRLLGIALLVFGVLLVFIYIAAFLHWTPPLVHPSLIVVLAIAAFIGGIAMYRDRDQSEL